MPTITFGAIVVIEVEKWLVEHLLTTRVCFEAIKFLKVFINREIWSSGDSKGQSRALEPIVLTRFWT